MTSINKDKDTKHKNFKGAGLRIRNNIVLSELSLDDKTDGIFTDTEYLQWVNSDDNLDKAVITGRLSDSRIILPSNRLPGLFPVATRSILGIKKYKLPSYRSLRLQQGLACDGITPSFLLT